MSRPTAAEGWQYADKDKAHEAVFAQVQAIERRQFDLFNTFVKLEALYDPVVARYVDGGSRSGDRFSSMATENVIASNIDTVTAIISATEVRARFMTDDAGWKEQRRARQLEWYSEALSTLLGVDDTCRQAFRDAALKGTGLIKVYIDDYDCICVDRVQVDDIVVDEAESRFGSPRQLHQRAIVDRETLIDQFPDAEAAIRAAHGGARQALWAEYRPIQRNEIVVVESWYLARGTKPDDYDAEDYDGTDAAGVKVRYRPGRHTICIEGVTLLDEEWHEGFPFVRIVWTPRPNGWYGISLAERIAGIQRALNRRNWHITAALDRAAAPVTYVNIADAKIAVQTINKIGTVAVIKSGQPPVTVNPPILNPEIYNSQQQLKASAFEESGVSRMTAQAAKPAGIDSGVAMREYRDQTTQRFSLQEKSFETLKLDTVLAMLACAKKLGARAPTVERRKRWGSKKIKWSQVDMGEAKVAIAAASTISRTPAGRMQTVLEWAQAGVVSMDEARRLMRHPDLERAMSIYTEALENVEEMLERIEDGEVMMPEPYQNLKMLVWRGQMEYMKISGDGAPEEILENMRQCIVQAAYILSGGSQPANANAGAPVAGAIPDGGAGTGAPQPMLSPGAGGPQDMMAAAMPAAGPGVAAFSPQAMQLIAGAG